LARGEARLPPGFFLLLREPSEMAAPCTAINWVLKLALLSLLCVTEELQLEKDICTFFASL
jgi:hypothetical protein